MLKVAAEVAGKGFGGLMVWAPAWVWAFLSDPPDPCVLVPARLEPNHVRYAAEVKGPYKPSRPRRTRKRRSSSRLFPRPA